MDRPITITQLMAIDNLAQIKGRIWIRKMIEQGRLPAINTGSKQRASFYIDMDEWDKFKKSLQFNPSEHKSKSA